MAGDTTLSAVTKMRLLVRPWTLQLPLFAPERSPTRIRLHDVQDEMLGGIKQEGQWAVLLLDGMTTQIISNVCGVSDVLDYGISREFGVCRPWTDPCT